MPKIVNLTGQTFYDLFVESEAEPRIRNSDGHKNRMWNCRCKCGNYITVSTGCLTTGNTKSCGCRKHDCVMLSRQKDLVGQIFHDLHVDSRADYKIRKNGTRMSMWNCTCICGNKCVISQNALVTGSTKSCGCRNIKNWSNKLEDLSGKRYSMLLVESYAYSKMAPSGQRIAYWNCLCNCGTRKIIRGTSLKSGYATSCGCYKKKKLSEEKIIDLTGARFGYLTVIERTQEYKDHIKQKRKQSYWRCLCDCGKEKVVPSSLLLGYRTTSCGCKGRSKGETLICKVLDSVHVKYKQWFVFEDLRGKKGAPLSFDFALLGDDDELLGLIEYQGEQHYNEKKGKWGSTQRLRTDKMKKEYCQKNNIILCEIRFDEPLMPALQNSLKIIYKDANPVPSSLEKV